MEDGGLWGSTAGTRLTGQGDVLCAVLYLFYHSTLLKFPKCAAFSPRGWEGSAPPEQEKKPLGQCQVWGWQQAERTRHGAAPHPGVSRDQGLWSCPTAGVPTRRQRSTP